MNDRNKRKLFGSCPKHEKNDIYTESYFNVMSRSMIPELKIYDDKKEDKRLVSGKRTSMTKCEGQLFNLEFQIERFDEIRLYLYWGYQSIRLQPSDFWEILPRLFHKKDEWEINRKFKTDEKKHEEIKQRFKMPDRYFQYWYKHFSIFNQPEKTWD